MKVVEKCDIVPLEPILMSVAAATKYIGRSERFIIDAIAVGKLQAVKSDRRTLLVVQSLKDYVAGLPAPKLRPDNRNRRSRSPGEDNRNRSSTRNRCKIGPE
jgi:hypothetical protein